MCIRQLFDSEKSDFEEIIKKGCFVTFNTEIGQYMFNYKGKETNFGGIYNPKFFITLAIDELDIK